MTEKQKPKFLRISSATQHRYAAKIVRKIFESLIAIGHSSDGLLTLESKYEELGHLLSWIKIDLKNLQQLSDRYHWHMTQASYSPKEHYLLPSIKTGDRPEGAPILPIAIYLDNIRSAHNIGSIIRTTEAFSLGSLYFSSQTAFADHKQVMKTSMGSYQWVSCYKNKALATLPKPIIALETSQNAVSLFNFKFPPSFTLILGNEEYGCSSDSLSLSDFFLEIPLCGRKNSLNVANAYAIAAAQIHHQFRC